MEAQSQSIVTLHWDSHFLEIILLPLAQKPQKTPKTMQVTSLLGLKYLRYGQKEFIASRGGSRKALSTKYFYLVDLLESI